MVFTRSKIFLILFLTLLLASCSKPTQQYARERYIVISKNLNIRLDPTLLSSSIGVLSKGDTIISLAADKFWVMVKVGDQTGFIASEYLQKLAPLKPPLLLSFLDKNSNVKSIYFWIITIVFLFTWVYLELRLVVYENRLKKQYNINTKRVSISPLIFFASAILTAILYLYWKDQVVESLFYNFSFLPKGMGSMSWIIWVQFATIIMGLIVDLISSIYISKVKFGLYIFLFEQIINLTIFSIAFFLTISIFIAAIILLVIFFAILYTFVMTENSILLSKVNK
ncbi:MAG TPA: hypothetical protein DIW31_07050 [Bacteroidales bacterium]|nr:hypothetical protein [Bacteroidales bacterium]